MHQRTITLAVAIVLVWATMTVAQTKPVPSFSFRGGSIERSKSFLIMEASILFRIARSSEYDGKTAALLMADLGYMRNVSSHWAIGGSGHFTLGEDDTKLGIRARARYWLTPRVGIDFMPGMFFYHSLGLEKADGPGLNFGTSLTFGELFSIDAYFESLPIWGYNYDYQGDQIIYTKYHTRRNSLYLGASGRSYFAPVVAGGVATAAFLWAAANLND